MISKFKADLISILYMKSFLNILFLMSWSIFFLRKSEMSSQTGSIFPLVLTLHTMTRNLIIGDCHVCLTTVLDQSRLISVALSIDFLVKKWVNAMAMRMIAMCRIDLFSKLFVRIFVCRPDRFHKRLFDSENYLRVYFMYYRYIIWLYFIALSLWLNK